MIKNTYSVNTAAILTSLTETQKSSSLSIFWAIWYHFQSFTFKNVRSSPYRNSFSKKLANLHQRRLRSSLFLRCMTRYDFKVSFLNLNLFTCIILAGSTLSSLVQQSRYTKRYFILGTFRHLFSLALSISLCHMSWIAFHPKLWPSKLNALVPDFLEEYEAAIMLFNWKY